MPRLLAALLMVSPCWAGTETAIRPIPSEATRRVATVQVRVTPDHRDWTYRLGEPARFRIDVTADGASIDGVTVAYTVAPERGRGETRHAPLPVGGFVIDGGTMREPGFLRCSVSAEVAGRTHRGAAAAAFEPARIQPTQTEPKDFDAFWETQKARLAKVPLDPRIWPKTEKGHGTVATHHVGIRTVGESWTGPARVYGILCEPRAPGRYPAVLKVPGAGVRPYPGDPDLAARGAVVLEIGIHGIPVDQPQEIYDQLLAGPLNEYWLFNLDDRERYYYNRVVLSAIRAIDFLATREAWDGRNLVVMGASQGGYLAIATAALDRRVTGLSATHPALCDLSGPLHGRPGGWPDPFAPGGEGRPSRLATPARIETAAYYDSVNFARRVKVPGHYIWGYNDESCPPTSMFAAYNSVTAPKELDLLLEVGHAYPAAQWEATVSWLQRFLGLR